MNSTGWLVASMLVNFSVIWSLSTARYLDPCLVRHESAITCTVCETEIEPSREVIIFPQLEVKEKWNMQDRELIKNLMKQHCDGRICYNIKNDDILIPTATASATAGNNSVLFS